MLPPAPPRFSTTIGWPSAADSGSSTMRPRTSMVEPAPNGTTARIGFVGHCCAAAASGRQAARSAAATLNAKRCMALLLCGMAILQAQPELLADARGLLVGL